MDFEQALRAGGTVMLKEGVDVNTLGVGGSPAPSSHEFASPTPPTKEMRTPRLAHQPSTPVIVPPTPSPAACSSSSSSSATAGAGAAGATSPALPSSSSSNEIFYDAEHPDMQTKRRSMYRSSGTSSSPDLATLVRKAKEKGGVVNAHQAHQLRKDKRQNPPPLPVSSSGLRPSATRPRSSTSSAGTSPAPLSPNISHMPRTLQKSARTPGGSRPMRANSPGNSDWVMANSSLQAHQISKDSGVNKLPKTSVRAKTSAFLGKMLGQGSTRDRQRPDEPTSPSYGVPAFMGAFSPPVPPLPDDIQRTPVAPPITDVFTSPRSNTHDLKPLPPIHVADVDRKSEDSIDDRSIVMVNHAPNWPCRPPSPQKKVEARPTNVANKFISHAKKRSMSAGEIDIKKMVPMSSSGGASRPSNEPALNPNTESQGWDSTLHGILSDFKGELSQLDPISTNSLDLRDPSTPSRRLAFGHTKTDTMISSPNLSQDVSHYRSPVIPSGSTPTPACPPRTEASQDQREVPPSRTSTEPIVPPRSSSLQSPIRSRSGSNPQGSPLHITPLRHGSSPLRLKGYGAQMQTSYRDSSWLRVHHRSTASSSEPSLIPVNDESRPSLNVTSQQDLTTNDLILNRYASNPSFSRSGDVSDLEEMGKERAARCYADDEEFLAKEKIAEWLGGQGQVNKVALRYYMDYFDFTKLRLDNAFRRLCTKLFLKAETQQVDRILEEFSRRYYDCNPNCVFGSASVVHAVSYSLLLLNTDLHVADLVTRMSRSQFVRNTMTAIQMQLQPNRFASSTDLTWDDSSSSRGTGSDGTETMSITRSKRSGSITSWNSISKDTIISSAGMSLATPSGTTPSSTAQPSMNSSTTSVQFPTVAEFKSSQPSMVYDRNWEIDMESTLKEMYNAIKSQQILQPLGSSFMARSSTSSLSPSAAHGVMARHRSFRGQPDRLATLKRGSIRGLQSILTNQAYSPYSSNSSIDGRVSPSPSFATSTHEVAAAFLTPTLGFASNLSHTIIREAQEDDDRSLKSHESSSTTVSITDEELALLGAPWAKEGMLCRKQYWESTGKRAKTKAWMDIFVVIQKGELSMFTFGEHGGGSSGVVGGGNWLESAQSMGNVLLAHSLAHALPPPGYNRQRPHCMVLTLANGGVYFFQAGTEELVNEWVSTCNYWAARTSREPLAGGVSNMEYGWNRVADPSSHGRSVSDNESRDNDRTDTMSVRSGRSSRSKFNWREGVATVRAPHSPWSDKTFVNDWKPPLPPSVASTHDEESQLEALQKHVISLKKDLKRHNELREPMASLYAPRTANASKAQTNWEKKSQYLLTEIVKYDSYIDSLQSAMALRLKKRGEKALERALVIVSPDDDHPNAAKGKWKGYPGEDTIPEADEPSVSLMSGSHRRELAEGG